MKQRMIAILIALLLPVAGCKSRLQTASGADSGGAAEARSGVSPVMATSGSSFDYYLLNLSWSPEYCQGHPTATECAARATFVLHGLWPENMDGSYPESCTSAPGPADPGEYKDIYPDPGLLQHEWQKHGTCSGLSADAYFQAARTAFRAVIVPGPLENLKSEISLTPGQIIDLFAASNPRIPVSSFALSCGHNDLTAVEICLDKSMNPISCTAVRSCRAQTVRITPP